MRTLMLTIDASKTGRTVESLLKGELRLSGGLISRLKRRPNGILVNGERAYTTHVVAAGDVLTVQVGDVPRPTSIVPAPMRAAVLWEDEDLLILDKPAGVTVHADCRRPEETTLEHMLAGYLPAGATAHPVSRLDRGTTGIITYAKSGYVHELLRRMHHTPDFLRGYRGVALGRVTPAQGTVAYPIGFAHGSTYRRAAVLPGTALDRAVPARTDYETLDRTNRYTLLMLIPRTGRTHQLRVHLAALGYPLAGDWLYGTETEAERAIDRPALHACALHLVHPITGQNIDLTSPMPADMARLME